MDSGCHQTLLPHEDGSCVQPPDASKPHVRWCGRVPGRNPRHPTRSHSFLLLNAFNDSPIVEGVCLRHSDGPMNIKMRLSWLVSLLLIFHNVNAFAEPGVSPTNTVRIAAAQAGRRVIDFRLKLEEALSAVW